MYDAGPTLRQHLVLRIPTYSQGINLGALHLLILLSQINIKSFSKLMIGLYGYITYSEHHH